MLLRLRAWRINFLFCWLLQRPTNLIENTENIFCGVYILPQGLQWPTAAPNTLTLVRQFSLILLFPFSRRKWWTETRIQVLEWFRDHNRSRVFQSQKRGIMTALERLRRGTEKAPAVIPSSGILTRISAEESCYHQFFGKARHCFIMESCRAGGCGSGTRAGEEKGELKRLK